jgi:hypothetical protein
MRSAARKLSELSATFPILPRVAIPVIDKHSLYTTNLRNRKDLKPPSRWSWMYFRHFLVYIATSMMHRSAEERVSCTPLCKIMMH